MRILYYPVLLTSFLWKYKKHYHSLRNYVEISLYCTSNIQKSLSCQYYLIFKTQRKTEFALCDCLPCGRQCEKVLCKLYFNHLRSPVKRALLSLSHVWGTWGFRGVKYVPSFTQLINGKNRCKTRSVKFAELCLSTSLGLKLWDPAITSITYTAKLQTIV